MKFNYENATFDNIDEAMWLRSEGWTPLMPNLIDMITFRAGLVTYLRYDIIIRLAKTLTYIA